jgi:hypothetical protein
MVIPQFAQAGLGHVVDVRQHISEPRLGIDVVELCHGDHAVHDGRPLSAAIGAVVCETQPAIAEEIGEASQRVSM